MTGQPPCAIMGVPIGPVENLVRIRVTDFVNDQTLEPNADFDEAWVKIGQQVKDQLKTFDPNLTWLNLYLSHDGKPSFSRTIEALTQE